MFGCTFKSFSIDRNLQVDLTDYRTIMKSHQSSLAAALELRRSVLPLSQFSLYFPNELSHSLVFYVVGEPHTLGIADQHDTKHNQNGMILAPVHLQLCKIITENFLASFLQDAALIKDHESYLTHHILQYVPWAKQHEQQALCSYYHKIPHSAGNSMVLRGGASLACNVCKMEHCDVICSQGQP